MNITHPNAMITKFRLIEQLKSYGTYDICMSFQCERTIKFVTLNSKV